MAEAEWSRAVSHCRQPWSSVVLSSTGLEDPCVFGLIVNDEVVTMLVVHVDDIKIAATKRITDSVVADLSKTLSTNHLGEVTWYMICLLYTSDAADE